MRGVREDHRRRRLLDGRHVRQRPRRPVVSGGAVCVGGRGSAAGRTLGARQDLLRPGELRSRASAWGGDCNGSPGMLPRGAGTPQARLDLRQG